MARDRLRRRRPDALRDDHRHPALYTDGVTDTRGATERFGELRLRELFARARSSSPEELLARLDGELGSFQVGAQADDTAVIAPRLHT